MSWLWEPFDLYINKQSHFSKIQNEFRCNYSNFNEFKMDLTSKMMEGLREKFWKWKKAFESKGLKMNLGENKSGSDCL